MIDDGFDIMESEMPIENSVFVGKIDDVFKGRDGVVIATDYISSIFPPLYKLNDVSMSAGYLRYVLNTNASARVVFRGGAIDIPDESVEFIWKTINSEDFQRVLSLSDDEQLKYANPASGVCHYCANKKCKYAQ